MGKSIKLPVFKQKGSAPREFPLDDFVASYTKALNQAPSFVKELKDVDHEGWQRVVDAIIKHAQANPGRVALVRTNPKNETEILLGNHPIIIVGGVLGAFVVGFAIGTACVKLGPCDFG